MTSTGAAPTGRARQAAEAILMELESDGHLNGREKVDA
jgi:hypothetical protein